MKASEMNETKQYEMTEMNEIKKKKKKKLKFDANNEDIDMNTNGNSGNGNGVYSHPSLRVYPLTMDATTFLLDLSKSQIDDGIRGEVSCAFFGAEREIILMVYKSLVQRRFGTVDIARRIFNISLNLKGVGDQ